MQLKNIKLLNVGCMLGGVCVFSLHLLVQQHHCRSSSPACALGCWRTKRILGQRLHSRLVSMTKRKQMNRKGRNPPPQRYSDSRGVSSDRGASRQTCQSLEQHSLRAAELDIAIMVNHGNKRVYYVVLIKTVNSFGFNTDFFPCILNTQHI